MKPFEKLKARIREAKARVPIELQGITLYIQAPGVATLSQVIQAGKVEAMRQLEGVEKFLKTKPLADGEWMEFLSRNGNEDNPEETIATLEQYGVPKNPRNKYDLEHARLAIQIASLYTMAAYITDEDGALLASDQEGRQFIIDEVLTIGNMQEISDAIQKVNDLGGNAVPTSQNSQASLQNGAAAKSEEKAGAK